MCLECNQAPVFLIQAVRCSYLMTEHKFAWFKRFYILYTLAFYRIGRFLKKKIVLLYWGMVCAKFSSLLSEVHGCLKMQLHV